MRASQMNRKTGWVVLLLCSAVLILHLTDINASSGFSGIAAGPSFTDPSQVIDMPKEWEAQPIKYQFSSSDAGLVVALDQHLYPALLPLINKYAKEHSMKIVVHEGTCGIAAGMLSNKTADIGGFCCPPGFTDRLPGLKYHTLGISSLALLVHKGNNIDNVTYKQAQEIFSGDIRDWSELSSAEGMQGENMPVQPIARLHCKLRPGHWRLLLDNQEQFSTRLLEVGAISDMISSVSSDERAIGYEVLWTFTRYKKRGEVKALKINNYSPYSSEALISGHYPLYRTYNLTTWEGDNNSNPRAHELVEYLLNQSEHIGREHYIIPALRLRQAGWQFSGNELVGDPG